MNLFDIYKMILCKILDEFPDKAGKSCVNSELIQSADDCDLVRCLPKCIYHYTSKEVFWKILMGKTDLYCTYYRELSDPKEFLTGICEVGSAWRRMCNGDTRKYTRLFAGIIAMSGDFETDYNSWAMSFSLNKDATHLWKEYTDRKDGGYAIGFKTENIIKKLREYKCFSNDKWSLISCLPCIYDGDDDADKIGNVVEYVLDEVCNKLTYLLDQKYKDGKNEEIARSILCMLLSSIIKHKDYREESEWRIVVVPFRMKSLIRMIGGKLRIKSGLFRRSELHDAIEEIVVSPHGPKDVLYDIARVVVGANYDARDARNKISVVSSGSPYRGGTER